MDELQTVSNLVKCRLSQYLGLMRYSLVIAVVKNDVTDCKIQVKVINLAQSWRSSEAASVYKARRHSFR